MGATGARMHNYDALHFETCYYQGIDYCIANRVGRHFEPGTQGEHKISRGFVPVTTWSAHWLRRPEFFAAIERFLDVRGKTCRRLYRCRPASIVRTEKPVWPMQ